MSNLAIAEVGNGDIGFLRILFSLDAAVGDFHRGFGEWLASKPWRINAMLGWISSAISS